MDGNFFVHTITASCKKRIHLNRFSLSLKNVWSFPEWEIHFCTHHCIQSRASWTIPARQSPRCNSVIEYTSYSSVWIMVAHLLHNHWYGINGHTNQGQRVLSGSTHCPSVILALGGRQPQPFWEVASSIKSLWHGRGGGGWCSRSWNASSFKG